MEPTSAYFWFGNLQLLGVTETPATILARKFAPFLRSIPRLLALFVNEKRDQESEISSGSHQLCWVTTSQHPLFEWFLSVILHICLCVKHKFVHLKYHWKSLSTQKSNERLSKLQCAETSYVEQSLPHIANMLVRAPTFLYLSFHASVFDLQQFCIHVLQYVSKCCLAICQHPLDRL